MHRIALGCLIVLATSGLSRADDTAQKKVNASQAAYDKIAIRASVEFWTQMVSADKRLLYDLQAAKKLATGDDAQAITDQTAAIQFKLTDDEQNISQRTQLPEAAIALPSPSGLALATDTPAVKKFLSSHPGTTESVASSLRAGKVFIGLPEDALSVVTTKQVVQSEDTTGKSYLCIERSTHLVVGLLIQNGSVVSIDHNPVVGAPASSTGVGGDFRR